MNKKKRRLRKLVKYVLTIIGVVLSGILLAHLICTSTAQYEEIAKECDNALGRTCLYYEVRQFTNK